MQGMGGCKKTYQKMMVIVFPLTRMRVGSGPLYGSSGLTAALTEVTKLVQSLGAK